MARRQNYSYERSQRDRAKVAKREAKREARAARKSGGANGEATATDAQPPEPSVAVQSSSPDATPAAEEGGASADGSQQSD